MSAAAAIKHDARGFYIPRAEMPQIDEADLPHLVATAFDAGHAPAFQAVAPASLHAHQRVNHALALSMSDEVKLKPALVSADGYVLDGNHRWWAHVHAGDQLMNVFQECFFLFIAKRKSNTAGSGPSGTTYTVHVCFGNIRYLIINYMCQVVNINTTCSNVGSYQYPGSAVFKVG